MTDITQNGEVVLYEAPEGGPALSVRLERETVWLSQRQMAELFDKDTDTVGLHIRNAFREGELDEGSTTEGSSVVQTEGGRRVRRPVRSYNLDGNKRIAAATFLWFLDRNRALYRPDGSKRIADNALAALTLLVAESRPRTRTCWSMSW